jgi:hypothetical protein
MKYNPHKYQRFCIDFIKNNPVAAILLDMGMGKTSLTLTAISDNCGCTSIRVTLPEK